MKKNRFKVLSIVILSCIILFGLVGCSDSSPDGKAYSRAKEIVIAQDKYPDTVKFLDDKKLVTGDNETGYDVFGEATSENGFGATVHIDFEINLTDDGNGGFTTGETSITQE